MATDATPDANFTFRWDRRYSRLASLFGVHASNSWVRVSADELHARFGPWSARTPLTNVLDTQKTGPYRLVTTMGPARGSFKDRGATFATNPDAGLCICFVEPLSILLPGGIIKSPGLTVTVADVDGLSEALGHR